MKQLVVFAIFIFSTLSLFGSGYLDSEDGWLYLSVAKNIYYTGSATALPNEYPDLNVNMNSFEDKNGVWRAPYARGYSLAMVPAVALSDLVHTFAEVPPVQRFPLEHDWSLHFFASFTNFVFASLLAIALVLYFKALGLQEKESYVGSFLTIFTTNLFPLSKFSFPQTLFTLFVFLAFYFVKRFSLTSQLRYLFFSCLSVLLAGYGYNISFLIAIPALMLYLYLLIPRRTKRFRVLLGVVLLLSLPYQRFVFLSLKSISLRTVFEGVWGYLFSPGKSLFLYSPPLLLLPMFWHKLRKKWNPELFSFLMLGISFMISYGSARLHEHAYIWHGGMGWGTRYIAVFIPFAMLLVFQLAQQLKKSAKLLVWYPLLALGIFVQLVGVANTYLVQYRNYQFSVHLGAAELSWYDYASFIPRYSPLITMTKELKQRIVDFPHTISRGKYDVRFTEGFLTPQQFGGSYFRGFRTDGVVTFKAHSSLSSPQSLQMHIYNAPDFPQISTSSGSITFQLNGETVATTALIQSSSEQEISIALPSEKLTMLNILTLHADYPATSTAAQVMYIKEMKLDGLVVNLRSLDYPDLSSINAPYTPYPYMYYGKVERDAWDYWHMRARLREESFDIWWINSMYYWDRPKLFFEGLFITHLAVFNVTGWYIWKKVRYTTRTR